MQFMQKSFAESISFIAVLIYLFFPNPCISSVVYEAYEKDSENIHVLNVQDSLSAFLTAIAVNGESIEPTADPDVFIGDIITFRVSIHSSSFSPLFDIKSETAWGSGFSYQGALEFQNMNGTYDPQNNKITAVIPRILREPDKLFWTYTFNLKIETYSDLFINVYSDELYTCQALKTYPISVQISRSDIQNAVPTFNAPDLTVLVNPECCRFQSSAVPLEWTIYVMNNGEEPAYNVRVTDNIGRNLSYSHSTIDGMAASPKLKNNAPVPGGTSMTWEIGNLAPAEMRNILVTVNPLDNTEDLDGYVNTINVSYGDEKTCCVFKDMEAPCYILPDKCIGNNVFERCGRLHGFFSITQMYKSNLYRTAENTEDTWATYFTPGIWAALPGSCDRIVEIVTSSASPGGLAVSPFYPGTKRKYQAYLLYSPQYEMYSHDSDNNMVSHQADVYFRYNTRNKFSFRVLDQFKRSHDSISSRALDIDDRYKTNLFSTLATLDLTKKLQLRLDYSNFNLNYDSSQNSRADRVDNSMATYGYFHFTPKTSFFANYEYSDISYRSNDLDSNENRFFAGFRWDVTKKTSGQIKGGFGEKDYDQPALSSADTWMAEIQVDHLLTSRTRLILNAYRRYDEPIGELVDKDDLQENFTKNILTHMVGLSLNYNFTTKLHLNLDTTLFYDEYKDEKTLSTRKERQDTEFAISPAIKFDFMKWLTFDLAYTYTNRDSNYSEFDYEDHTVYLRASIYQ
ncbi:MAG: hypothetical protein AVO38_03490 [delta proteobacterium ML8_D]|nr:MAG: hypothetical protein AVO38_03490 [delta proteobacterium ML8_D]